MVYLKSMTFPNADLEHDFIMSIRRTCYESFYPFKILSRNDLYRLDFNPITILYGGNGSGKSTVLNVIAEKLQISRDSIFNKTVFFNDYVKLCDVNIEQNVPDSSKIITSDDVFDYMLNIRSMNERIDSKREEITEEYLDAKYSNFQLRSIKDYEQLKKVNHARHKTQSRYINDSLMKNIRELSNGESAFFYFTQKIYEEGLYLLDEPENSLEPKKQLELVQYLEDSARFFGCQFIISTHSPFLLAMEYANIYNLDKEPVEVEKWTELENIRTYYEFFKKHEGKFESLSKSHH